MWSLLLIATACHSNVTIYDGHTVAKTMLSQIFFGAKLKMEGKISRAKWEIFANKKKVQLAIDVSK